MNKRILSIIGILVVFLFVGLGLTAQLAQAAPADLPDASRCSGTQDTVYECLDSRDPGGPVYAFQDIAGNNPPLTYSNNDDGVVRITMPFAFTLYGLSSDLLTVSMNGAIKFGSHISAINAFNTDLDVAPEYFIAPFWDDIDNSPGIGGGVYTDVVGFAPDRQFIIQWQDIPHYNNTDASTFQVVFYETSNDLIFQYEDVDFNTSNFDWGASATIGIRGTSGTGLQYLYNTAVLDTDAEHGTVNLNYDGSFTYTPDAGYTGADYFWYHVHDGSSNSGAVMVGIYVFNNPATVRADSYTTSQSSVLNVSAPGVLGNDSDAEGDVITAVLDNTAAHGSLTLNSDGSFTYTPTSGFKGADSFTYHVDDGVDSSTAATVVLTVENIVPVATNDAYTATVTQPLTISAASGVLENDGDAGGDTLTAVLDTSPAHGNLSFNSDGSFSYTADFGYLGADSFTYHATDGADDSNTVTVNISIEGSYLYLPMIIR